MDYMCQIYAIQDIVVYNQDMLYMVYGVGMGDIPPSPTYNSVYSDII